MSTSCGFNNGSLVVSPVSTTAISSLTLSDSTAGDTAILALSQSNNTNTSSNASLRVSQGGTGGGYTNVVLNKGSTRSWSLGMQNSTGTNLKLTTTNASNVTPATGITTWQMTATGYRNLPFQPAFAAYLANPIPNVTGDGTKATCAFDTLDFDVTASYNPITGIFTVPASGIYLLSTTILFVGTTTNINEFDVSIVAPTLSKSGVNVVSTLNSDYASVAVDSLFLLNAGDSVSVKGTASGSATKVIGFAGNSATPSNTYVCFFSGFMLA